MLTFGETLVNNSALACLKNPTLILFLLQTFAGTCEVNKWFKDSISECNGFYSQDSEETKQYSQGWRNGRKKPEDINKGNMLRFLTSNSENAYTSWEHINAFEAHHILPIIGTFATYSGGGYVLNLNRSLKDSNELVNGQQESSWLDAYTSAVHAEFVTYNPTINMVAAVTLTFELPPLGGVFKSCEIFAVNMYSGLRKHPVARIVGEIIAVILLLIMLVRVGLTIFHDKLKYFKDLSKGLDLILVSTGIVIVFLRVLKEGFKKLATDQFNEDPHQFLDFYQCGFYDELTDYAFAFFNFVAIVRLSVLLQFLSCLDRVLRTIARCFYELLACLFVFFCLMMAFSSLFKLAFNTDSDDFKDFSSSLQTSTSYMARMVRSSDYGSSSSYTSVRALALFSCCLTLIFFYLTVIRSIFIVGYRQILTKDRGKVSGKSFEAGVFEIFMDKFKELAGIEREIEIFKAEEDDPKEVLLRAQRNYIDKSQFFRLRNLINEAYTDDFADDLGFFEVMSSTNEIQTSTNDVNANARGPNEIQDRKSDSLYVETVETDKGDNTLPEVDNNVEQKVHVSFDLSQRENGEDATNKTGEVMRSTSPASNEEKVKLLEQLVQEKMRALQRKQKEGFQPATIEHEMQMLSRLQQRIRDKKRE